MLSLLGKSQAGSNFISVRRSFLMIVTLTCICFQGIFVYNVYLGQEQQFPSGIALGEQVKTFDEKHQPAEMSHTTTRSTTTTHKLTTTTTQKVTTTSTTPTRIKVFSQMNSADRTGAMLNRVYVNIPGHRHLPIWLSQSMPTISSLILTSQSYALLFETV